jgi:8-oxo-dGTP diphosphatase
MAGSSSRHAPPTELHVAAGVVCDGSGRVLIAQRTAGRHLAGHWEFPGGKVAPGETAIEALARELREEIGIEVGSAEPLVRYRHAYPERVVLLDVWLVTGHAGEPRALEGQPLRWETPDRLLDAGLLEADRPIVEALLSRS